MPPVLVIIFGVLGALSAGIAIGRWVYPIMKRALWATVGRRRTADRALYLLFAGAAIPSVINVLGEPTRKSVGADEVTYIFADYLYYISVRTKSETESIVEYSVTTRHRRFNPTVKVPWRNVRLGLDAFAHYQQGEIAAVFGASARYFGFGYTEVYHASKATLFQYRALSYSEGGVARKLTNRDQSTIPRGYGLSDGGISLTADKSQVDLGRYLADPDVRKFREGLAANTFTVSWGPEIPKPRDITGSFGPGQHLPIDLARGKIPWYVELGLASDAFVRNLALGAHKVVELVRHPVGPMKRKLRSIAPKTYLRLWRFRNR